MHFQCRIILCTKIQDNITIGNSFRIARMHYGGNGEGEEMFKIIYIFWSSTYKIYEQRNGYFSVLASSKITSRMVSKIVYIFNSVYTSYTGILSSMVPRQTGHLLHFSQQVLLSTLEKGKKEKFNISKYKSLITYLNAMNK